MNPLFEMLRQLEWSGRRHGQGDGPMGSGPGPAFAACPICRGLKEPNGHFISSAVGHRPDCRLAALIHVSEEEAHILLHSLGLTRGTEEYRNHFVTGEDTVDYPHCMALVEKGLMTRRDGSPHFGGGFVFFVTEAGKQEARRIKETTR